MPKKGSNIHAIGDRIYKTKRDEDRLSITEDVSSRHYESIKKSTDQTTKQEIICSDYSKAVERFEQILDSLDHQTADLNKIQATRTSKSIDNQQLDTRELHEQSLICNSKSFSSSSSLSRLSRQLKLNSYLEENIQDQAGGCGCRFNFIDENELLDEQSEQFDHRCHQRRTLRDFRLNRLTNSSSIGGGSCFLIETNSNSCNSLYEANNQATGLLLATNKPSFSDYNQDFGLFIDDDLVETSGSKQASKSIANHLLLVGCEPSSSSKRAEAPGESANCWPGHASCNIIDKSNNNRNPSDYSFPNSQIPQSCSCFEPRKVRQIAAGNHKDHPQSIDDESEIGDSIDYNNFDICSALDSVLDSSPELVGCRSLALTCSNCCTDSSFGDNPSNTGLEPAHYSSLSLDCERYTHLDCSLTTNESTISLAHSYNSQFEVNSSPTNRHFKFAQDKPAADQLVAYQSCRVATLASQAATSSWPAAAGPPRDSADQILAATVARLDEGLSSSSVVGPNPHKMGLDPPDELESKNDDECNIQSRQVGIITRNLGINTNRSNSSKNNNNFQHLQGADLTSGGDRDQERNIGAPRCSPKSESAEAESRTIESTGSTNRDAKARASSGSLDDCELEDERSASMRAVKEIAKLSAPSLAALQYLPGQVEAARSSIKSQVSNGSDGNLIDKRPGSNKQPATRMQEPASKPTRGSAESSQQASRADKAHFMNRLCLCNCISREHHNSRHEPTKGVESGAASDTQLNYWRRADKCTSGEQPTSAGGQANNCKLGASHNNDDNSNKTQLRRYKKKPQNARPKRRQSQSLGVGEQLAPTPLCESLGAPAARGDKLSGDEASQSCASSSLEARSSSPKRTLSYRKLLSPSKLFTSRESSLADEDCGAPEAKAVSRSFLSRSLGRLSCRSKSSSKRQSQAKAERKKPNSCHAGELRPNSASSTAGSPSKSISITSQTPDSLTGSIGSSIGDEDSSRTRSPIERQATKSRLSLAPEITLSKVEYSASLRPDDCSSGRSAKSYNAMASSKKRYKSERQITGRPELVADHQASPNGPFSLPGSPRPIRSRNPSARLSQSPVPFRSPAIESTKIEDGLRVCSIEHFEKHIDSIKGNQIEAQKRLFTAWINHFCPNLIRRDLVEELRDGIKLIGLLATLSHDRRLLASYERLNRDKQSYINRLAVTPSSRLKHLSNASMAIDYLRNNLGMKLVNLNAMDIVSGKANVILGLCWNIILHFQLEQQSFFRHHSDTSSNYSSELSHCTSRLSSGQANEDCSRARPASQQGQQFSRATSSSLIEEYTPRDLVEARKRLLEHVNKRFNLKLTNLSSNLVDGDVLLIIIKNLITSSNKQTDTCDRMVDVQTNEAGQSWSSMSHDEKLDHCFQLANKHLKVPLLFSSTDLRQQSFHEQNSKPLLVYLSMLLNSTDSNHLGLGTSGGGASNHLQLGQGDTSDSGPDSASSDKKLQVERLLEELDTEDKFQVDKLQSTIEKVRRIDSYLSEQPTGGHLDARLAQRHAALKQEVAQLESLIDWINQADRLFETTHASASDMAHALEQYQGFFSPARRPLLTVSLSASLERQYRECLATAKQRIMSMEQTMKNWLDYEQARERLRSWLIEAELRLAAALRNELPASAEAHEQRLAELVSFFELEPAELVELEAAAQLLEGRPATAASGLEPSNKSLSSSLVSLGSSVCSRPSSTLASSKRAVHQRLFEQFELKCRLLAAMLEAPERDALLLGVKELKSRLKYITEHRVPQVLSELLLAIGASGQSLDECCADAEAEANAEADEDQDAPVVGVSEDSLAAGGAPAPSAGAQKQSQQQQPQPPSRVGARNKSRRRAPRSAGAARATGAREPDAEPSLLALVWAKLVRASRLSMSFNIVLLLCLAGVCIVPLITSKQACELSQTPAANQRFGLDPKPI